MVIGAQARLVCATALSFARRRRPGFHVSNHRAEGEGGSGDPGSDRLLILTETSFRMAAVRSLIDRMVGALSAERPCARAEYGENSGRRSRIASPIADPPVTNVALRPGAPPLV